jgi:hypothetical protein
MIEEISSGLRRSRRVSFEIPALFTRPEIGPTVFVISSIA